MEHLNQKHTTYLVVTMCICMFASTVCLCSLLVSARMGAQTISTSVQATQTALIEQNVKAATTREALNATLRSMQQEIVRVDVEMDEREKRLDARISAGKN